MDGDRRLVQTVLDRLSSRLPIITGEPLSEVMRNSVVQLSRQTMIDLSRVQIDVVIACIVGELEKISRQYEDEPPQNRPPHLLSSQAYLAQLLADCTSTNWDTIDGVSSNDHEIQRTDGASPIWSRPRRRDPKPLEETQAVHVLEVMSKLAAATIMPEGSAAQSGGRSTLIPKENNADTVEHTADLERAVFSVFEYLSASNWDLIYRTIQLMMKTLKKGKEDESDPNSLKFMAYMWLSSKKLSLVIQEITQSFLHIDKIAQNVVANLLPLAVQKWIDTNPQDFVHLHSTQKKLDGSVDLLFDYASSVTDNAKRKVHLWPLQTALVILLPEIFDACYLDVSRSASVQKKVYFLDNLRKALRLPKSSDIAASCLVSICQAASHFPADSDSPLLSFALDVQNEMREEIFKRQLFAPGEYEPAVERDVMVKAFVSLCRLSMDNVIQQLIPRCLDKNSPVAFKVTVFAGAAILAANDPNDEFQPLYEAITPALREYLYTVSSLRKQNSMNGGDRGRESTLDRRQIQQLKNMSSESIGSTDLLYQMLDLLKVRPITICEGISDKASWDSVGERIMSCIHSLLTDDEEAVRLSTGMIIQKNLNNNIGILLERFRREPSSEYVGTAFWKYTSPICITLSRRLLDADFRDPTLRGTLEMIHGFLEGRLHALRTYKQLTLGTSECAERSISNASLEVSLLILLCSSDLDICSLTTHTIGILCEEGKLTENPEDLASSNLTIMRNFDVYSELSLQSFRITGPVAFQTRLRKLLLRMNVPSPGILTAWEAVFMRWRQLCNLIMSVCRQIKRGTLKDESPDGAKPGPVAVGNLDSKLHIEWRNYSGFLASIGGSCIADATQQDNEEEEDSSQPGHRWIDRTTSDGDSISLLERFMKQCVQLLVCALVNVRENMKQVLGSELNPKLYAQLFRSLREELVHISGGSSSRSSSLESRALFAEQAASLLKIIVERTEETQDAFLTSDLGDLTLSLTRLPLPNDPATVSRVRTKICQLVELLAKKKEILNLRQDIRVRNALLVILAEWLPKPERKGEYGNGPAVTNRTSESQRLGKDLDKACMKAIASLLHRLPLQTAENHHDADVVDAKSQLFCGYFTVFLNLLDPNYSFEDKRHEINGITLARDEATSFQELTIQALSNLLSANVDVGLKYSLEIGYHEDMDIRTAFMHVLTNILTQGTQFSSIGDSAIAEKYGLLTEMLVNDLDFALALCETCPSSEIDELTIALLNIFDSRGLAVTLLKELIEREVARTESEAILLRRNCLATKMLSVFARWKGSEYLKATLQPVLERLILKFDDLSLELDPEKNGATEESLQQSNMQLQHISRVFIDAIMKSAKKVPDSFRQICYAITKCVENKFPEAKYTAVGAFIFLRFFCPAIVSPEQDNLISAPMSKEVRRGLVLITKIIQNLANNVLFGHKEPWMLPLNRFLADHIVRITDFLREISRLPAANGTETALVSTSNNQENFDFGSTVALHRFLYDHWETIKRKLVHQERMKRSKKAEEAAIIARDLVTLNDLVPSLGAPPQDVFLGKLQIASTIQPAYSKFQHFMLKNSGRSVESILSARIVYDGGESKDGMPVICVILRNINAETIDTDLYIYCFLKVASKLWHRPFGVLVDATCYSVQNELSEEVTRKLESLMPPDMVNSLSRYYVYNMNTAYKKIFRKTLRYAMRDDNHAMNPKNISYVLLGSLPELQSQFHLGSLHLPKDTISLVHDSRFTFERVTWVSRSQGKVEVVIKVGSQYVQITTANKQEIHPGLGVQATVNDIFRLSDVEDGDTSFRGATGSSEEENRFGLKCDKGKVLMFFVSPLKADIVQAIKSAKSKHTKDGKGSKLSERVIRPEDVPGTLLNISLMNMATLNHSLRLAAFELFCTLCKSFSFKIDKQFVSAKGLSFPAESVNLIVSISDKLATNEPKLTFDFLTEFFVGWEKTTEHQRPLNILYMVPWLRNLRTQLLTTSEGDYEKGKERLAIIARKLIEATMKDANYTLFVHHAWSVIAKDEALLEVFLEELLKVANSAGFGSAQAEMVSSIAASFTGVGIRGKVIARLRRFLHRTSLRPSRHLSENPLWSEICVLMRICLALSFDSKLQAEIYLPELFHIITMTVNCGQLLFRASVHSLLVNTVQSICSSFDLTEENLLKLKNILVSLSEPKYTQIFNSNRLTARDPGMPVDRQMETSTTTHSIETVTGLLLEVIRLAAPTHDAANIWRARWMSLVASTSFQSNPAIQPRAFAVMGCLAKEDVDDDLLYQVLVALRSALHRYLEEADHEMLNSILISLTKMMENFSYQSRYLFQLFWVAVSLVRCGSIHVFPYAAGLVEAVLRVINSSGEFRDGRMATILMAGRHHVEETAAELDALFKVYFTVESFHHAMLSCFIRGLHEPSTKAAAMRALTTIMEIGIQNQPAPGKFTEDSVVPPYLGVLAARNMDVNDTREVIAGGKLPHLEKMMENIPSLIANGKLRAVTMIMVFAIIDFHTSEESVQLTALSYFQAVAKHRPEAFLLGFDRIVPTMNDIMRNSQNPLLLEACRSMLCIISADSKFTIANKRAGRERLEELLREWAVPGVWDTASFKGIRTLEREGMNRTDRLIDVGFS